MSPSLRELYQEVILDHNRRPRNMRRLEEPTSFAEGHNPLCGDQVKVYLHTEGDLVTDISFEGQGCAISTASASMMTEVLKGKSVDEAESIFRRFQAMVTELGAREEDPELGDLEVLAGVREHPVRIKCATLPWHALHAALQGSQGEVTTE